MSNSNISDLLRSASAADTAALKARLVGEVIVEGEPEYESARQVHNLRFDRKPAVIVQARGAADVAETVKFARACNLDLAVRSGGHSAAGLSTIDGGLVLDLSEMRAVTIDPAAKTARAQAGATSADLAAPAHAYGLSVSTGDTASVGLGGLITGGGIGWMARKHGLAIDNLLSAEVVTADGEILRASATQHPELFWAIRGGGGNFGVVTEFELKLRSDGSVYGGVLVLPATAAVISGYLDYALSAADELTTIAKVMKAPPAPFIPAEFVGQPVLMINVCYAGSGRAGTRAVQPLRRLATPIGESLSPMPYPVLFDFTAASAQPGHSAIRSGFADSFSDESLETIVERVADAESPRALVQLRPLGGAIARVSSEATAFAHRERNFLITVIGSWDASESNPAAREAWVTGTWAEIRPETHGAFANFLADEGSSRVREAYPGATYARLACIKSKYDPENLFHLNQNIRPGSSVAGEQAA
jgi:hypothetical protein